MNNSLFKVFIFLFYSPIFLTVLLKNLGFSYSLINIIFSLNEFLIIFLGLGLLKFKINKIALISLSLIFMAFISSVFKEVNLVDYLIPAIVFNRFVIFIGFVKIDDTKNYLFAKKIFGLFIYSQLIIGIFQLILPSIVIDLTLPPQPTQGYHIIAKSFDSWNGTIFGLFTDTVSYPFTLIVGYLFFLKEKKMKFWMQILFAICIIQGKSVIASLFFVIIIITQLKKLNRIKILLFSFLIIIFSANFILNEINFYSIYKMFLDQRLGIILWVMPELLINTSLEQLLFGVGIGEPLETFIYAMKDIPGLFLYDKMGINGLNDVYYVAIMSYYGLIGLLTVIIFYYHFYKRWGNSIYSKYILTFIIISLAVNQTTQLSFFSLLCYSHIDLFNFKSTMDTKLTI